MSGIGNIYVKVNSLSLFSYFFSGDLPGDFSFSFPGDFFKLSTSFTFLDMGVTGIIVVCRLPGFFVGASSMWSRVSEAR